MPARKKPGTDEKLMDRNEFLQTLGRVAVGIGLAAAFVKLGGFWPGDKKRKFTVCNSYGICARCSSLAACEQPQALSYRRAKGGRA
jgi:hypothetical protein